jgi:peptidyl-prolyl cis-trans isomerase C
MKMSVKRSFKLIFGVLTLSLLVCIAVTGCKKGGEEKTETASAPSAETSKSAASTASSADSGEVAAFVNGEKIFKSDLDAIVTMYSSSGGMGQHAGVQMDEEALNKLRKEMLNQMIDGEILYQLSKATPVEDLETKAETEFASILQQYGTEENFAEEVKKNNLTVEKVKANLKKNIMIRNYVDNEILAKIEVSEDDMKKHYDENKENYEAAEQVKASHILIKVEENFTQEQKDEAMEKIKKVQERLKAGEDFAEVAKEVSEGPSGSRGGDLGFFGKGQMVKPFETAAFTLKKDELSDIVETQFGYHIIKASGRKAGESKPFEAVKASIEENLKREVFQQNMTKIVEDSKAKATIEIVE